LFADEEVGNRGKILRRKEVSIGFGPVFPAVLREGVFGVLTRFIIQNFSEFLEGGGL